MKLQAKITLLSILAVMVLSLVACNNEGGAEKVGKKIDKTFDSAKDKVHDATK
jgi:hypothetical protein